MSDVKVVTHVATDLKTVILEIYQDGEAQAHVFLNPDGADHLAHRLLGLSKLLRNRKEMP